MTDSPAAPDAPPVAGPVAGPAAGPVVGMVGAGQLARMTAQAAIGLGVGFRVLADSAGRQRRPGHPGHPGRGLPLGC